MKKNTRSKQEHDIAKILRKNGFVAADAAFELWRQGVSTRDIALAPLLSDAQRLDLIGAVDRLVNSPHLGNPGRKDIMRQDIYKKLIAFAQDQEGYEALVDLYDCLYHILGEPIVSTVPNRREKTMPDDKDLENNSDCTEFGPMGTVIDHTDDMPGPIGPFNPMSTVIDQDEENDKQREAADAAFDHCDADIAHLTADKPDGEDLGKAVKEDNQFRSGISHLGAGKTEGDVMIDGEPVEIMEADVGDLKSAFESSSGTKTPDAELEDDEAALEHAKAQLVSEEPETPEEIVERVTLAKELEEVEVAFKDTPSDEDLARLHVALKDPHNGQEGEGFVATPRIPGVREDDYSGDDPDRERLTGVDHILKKEESSDTTTFGPAPVGPKDMPPLQPICETIRAAINQGPRDIIREFVYRLIDGERDYQDNKFDQTDKDGWTPHDWLALIEAYVFEARDISGDPNAQMNEIRKICALAVFAMERIATPARV